MQTQQLLGSLRWELTSMNIATLGGEESVGEEELVLKRAAVGIQFDWLFGGCPEADKLSAETFFRLGIETYCGRCPVPFTNNLRLTPDEMMPFAFPAPPPPPPRATQPTRNSDYPTSRRSSGRGWRGRGGSGRGRGNRFGGSTQNDDIDATAYRQVFSQGSHPSTPGDHTQTPSERSGRGLQQPAWQHPAWQHPAWQHPAWQHPAWQGQTPAFVSPDVHPDAAFSPIMQSIPAGPLLPSSAAFGQPMLPTVDTVSLQPAASLENLTQLSAVRSYGVTNRDEGGWDANETAHHSPLPARRDPGFHPKKVKTCEAKVLPPPPVPSFGMALPGSPKNITTRPTKRARVAGTPKSKFNSLGLTPRDLQKHDISSEDDDADEEANSAAMPGQGIVFQHDGQVISLATKEDVVMWIAERKRQWPSRARTKEKEEAADRKRENELKYLRRVKGRTNEHQSRGIERAVQPTQRGLSDCGPLQTGETNHRSSSDAQTMASEGTQSDIANRGWLRSRSPAAKKASLTQPILPPSTKSATVDLGLNYLSGLGESSDSEDSSLCGSQRSCDTDVGSAASASNSAPEVESSKAVRPTAVSPPRFKMQSKGPTKRSQPLGTCRSWARYGNCRFGSRCKWAHSPAIAARTALFDKVRRASTI